VRRVLAIVFGLLWGAAPLQGQTGLLAYAVLSTLLVQVHFKVVLGVVPEDLGVESAQLAKEGFMDGLATFLLCWTLTYSSLWFL
jgi:hypothetical protein